MNFKPLWGVTLAILLCLGSGFSQSDVDKVAKETVKGVKKVGSAL